MVAAAELRFDERQGSITFGTVGVHDLPAWHLERLAGIDLAGAVGRDLLAVYTTPVADGQPPILGERRIVDGVLRFLPRFVFRPGLGYRARFRGEVLDRLTGSAEGTTADLELNFEPAQVSAAPATRVEAVYPSADVLPENQLRLYVWFSAPMRQRRIVEGIRLIETGNDRPVELPFVEVADGLWDPSGRRLTLFFHPGRVKRGVGPRLALGPPLREGVSYRLEIDGSLRDSSGRPLADGHTKSFAVGPPDRRSPELLNWRLSPPGRASGALKVDFPEPLDHGLLLRLLAVHDVTGRQLAGEVTITRDETRWSFQPAVPWKPGGYLLRVATSLEDLAGNTPERLFDEATESSREPRPPDRSVMELRFTVPAGD